MALVGTPPRYLKVAEGEQAKAKDAGLKGHVSSSASFLTRPMGVVTNREAELGSLPLFSLKDNRNDSNKLSSSRLYQVRGKEKAAAVLAFLLQKQEIETKQQQQADTNTTNSQTGWVQLREKVVPSRINLSLNSCNSTATTTKSHHHHHPPPPMAALLDLPFFPVSGQGIA
mmetsp:Transcript_41974/g.67513  ORF Transcript_41974/g.67513 Transcript_41974/m.67513 type:complete len:171 (-) Transcript_41974:1098-1610(-)